MISITTRTLRYFEFDKAVICISDASANCEYFKKKIENKT